jgi:eukaryotic-like serine/threonine-protein kinase
MRYVPTGSSAAGGIGTVMFCQDTNLDRKVAIKFIQPGGEHRRLLDELASLQKIRSKHVVQIFDVTYVNPGSRMGIVEEFIDGKDLEPLLGKTKPTAFVRLLYQMAAGLADIHAVDIVHRDFKPNNTLIDADGILKIIDFNLARRKDAAHTQGFVGTRGYAAPELYADGTVDFDESVDVYALGVTAFALLKGPVLPKEMQSRPPEPQAWLDSGGGFAGLGLHLDPKLVTLLDKCFSEAPSKRPAASAIRDRAARVLLRGKHRAFFTYGNGQTFELSDTNPNVNLKNPLGEIGIAYDMLDFKVASTTGEVWINNMQLPVGAVLPGSCVIALGGPQRRAYERAFITMDVSHPEVVL